MPLLEERGWQFRFWAPRPSELFDHIEAQGLHVDGAPRQMSFSLRALRLPPGPRQRITGLPPYLARFRRFARGVRPAVLHANSLATLPEALIGRALRVPTVLHVHEMVPETRKGRLAARVARASADELVAVSRACGERLAGDGSARPRIVFESAPIPDTPLRRPQGPDTVVGTVGVVSRRKGSDVFVEAAAKVRAADPGIRFEMVGPMTDPLDADFAQETLDRARELGISHVSRADVPRKLSEWDIFALPSRRDPCPISLLEAMAGGLPVVGTAVDGIAEQVTPSVGRLVPTEDADALAAAILELHGTPEARSALGDAGRRRAIERFSPEAQAEGIHAAYVAARS